MLPAKLCHRHTALSLAQDRKYLSLTKSRLFHQNLLDQNAEKILLINPLNCRGDYPRKQPIFIFACGLYDRNSLFVEDLARLALALGVKIVDFWNLHDHDHTDNGVGEDARVQPLDALSDTELRPRLEVILRAVALLRSRGVIVSIHGDFVDILARRVGLDG